METLWQYYWESTMILTMLHENISIIPSATRKYSYNPDKVTREDLTIPTICANTTMILVTMY